MATPVQPSPEYSKEELLRKLKEEPESWNDWWQGLGPPNRKQVDVSGLNLQGVDLRSRKLFDANLAKCNFNKSDLRDVDFSGANLYRAQMSTGTCLWRANFTNATLSKAILRRARLQNTNFTGANLFNTDFRNANLRAANLADSKGGLRSRQLAGADLTGAKLPEPLTKLYEKLETVGQISDSAKKLFIGLLAGCLYCWLTIGTTKDVDLITNRASSPLPIIQTAIPIVGFYVVAPIILICIYFYFHFYLQKLWEELAQLPAIFPDGKPLYQRADPWLFNDLVRAYFSRLKKNRPFLSKFQSGVSILFAWWLVPITLFLFWGRYLPRHDLLLTILLALILSISIACAFRLYRLAKDTLRGDERGAFMWTKAFKTRRTYTDIIRMGLIVTLVIATSIDSISGIPVTHELTISPETGMITASPHLGTWAPSAMWFIGYSPFADLEDADISTKPANWTGKKEEELDLVKGADLSDRDLRYANARGAFLAKAQLKSTNFQEAKLSGADLRQAQLNAANLNYVDLSGALLRGTNLGFAHLRGAKLYQTNLSGASLQKADIREAELVRVNLIGADLSDADLTGTQLIAQPPGGQAIGAGGNIEDLLFSTNIKYANFKGTKGIQPQSIKECTNWQMAFYDYNTLRQLGLPYNHNEQLQVYLDSKSEEPFDSWQIKWRVNKAKNESKPK